MRCWNRFPRGAVDAPSLELFKVRLGGALSNLFYCTMFLPMAGVGLDDFWRSLTAQTAWNSKWELRGHSGLRFCSRDVLKLRRHAWRAFRELFLSVFFQLWLAEDEEWCLLQSCSTCSRGGWTCSSALSGLVLYIQSGLPHSGFGKGMGLQLLQGCCRRTKLN